MSEQVRFKIEGCKVNPDLASIYITFVKDENGEYVRYDDYARIKAELERVTKENETINKDRALLWASHKIALQDIQGLHYALQVAKEGKQS